MTKSPVTKNRNRTTRPPGKPLTRPGLSSKAKIILAMLTSPVLIALIALLQNLLNLPPESRPSTITAVGVVTNTPLSPTSTNPATPAAMATIDQPLNAGRLTGVLTDQAGSPISDMEVSVRNGPKTRTDKDGKFVLNNVPLGDQLIVVTPPSGKGNLTLNVRIDEGQNSQTSIVYDVSSGRIGLLAITAPVDDSSLEVLQDGTTYRAVIYGRCDGLKNVFDNFDVWVLVSSISDSKFWLQHPPAVIDPSTETWRAKILLGDPQHPPQDGEQWDIVAIAAESSSDIGRILNVGKLSLLPPNVGSNVVTVKTHIVH